MLQLYAHPFSSYSQKVLVALYANGTPFEYRNLEDPGASAEWKALWPIGRFPVLVDDGRVVFEASAILEYLDAHHRGPLPLLHGDGLDARMLDRFFDRYVMEPMQKIVLDHMREPGERDPRGVADAHAMLGRAYAWLDRHMARREWAAGDAFGLADCAAAPSLFYADWVQPIPEALASARAYRARLLAFPPMARAVDEARPYRHYFPPGAPDRD